MRKVLKIKMHYPSVKSNLLHIIFLIFTLTLQSVLSAVWHNNMFYENVNKSSFIYANTTPSSSSSSTPDDIHQNLRQSRYSPLINACTTNEGTSGTCLTRFNCMRQGGTAKGFCSTYGVCCETNLQCGQSSNLKRIIMKNPVQLPTTCQYTITPYSNNVCQLLIEFQRFELQPPTEDAVSQTLNCPDSFQVGNNFKVCGENAGQHFYVPFNVAAGQTQIPINFNLPNQWSQTTWYIVVTQLECPAPKNLIGNGMILPFVGQTNIQDLRTIFSTKHSDLDLLAPAGCFQYFREPTGTIKSFGNNYYMMDLKYTICLKPSAGTTMIEYTVNKFSLSMEQPNAFYDEDCHPTIFTEGRKEDYLVIPNSMFMDNPEFQPTYYCGQAATAGQVIVAAPPYMMFFSSDGQWSAEETGFSISYRVKTTL